MIIKNINERPYVSSAYCNNFLLLLYKISILFILRFILTRRLQFLFVLVIKRVRIFVKYIIQSYV